MGFGVGEGVGLWLEGWEGVMGKWIGYFWGLGYGWGVVGKGSLGELGRWFILSGWVFWKLWGCSLIEGG